MIAVDTSSLIAYLAGEGGPDVEALDQALAHNRVHFPPVVVTEMLSAPAACGAGSWPAASRPRSPTP